MVSLLDTIGMIGRSLAAPPGVSADYVQALRTAFDKMVVDTEFRTEAQKMQLRVTPRTGADLQKDIAASMSSLSAAAVQRARALVN